MKRDNDFVWEYAVKNEQYSRKNNLRIHGLKEEQGENLEEKFVRFVRENLQEEIRPDEIEIIPRICPKKFNNGDQGSMSARTRPVIVKLLSNESKMKILLKRKQLKGKGVAISEDMADDIAKRLKQLKKKRSIESAWFSNGKVKYKQYGNPQVKEFRGWYDLGDIDWDSKLQWDTTMFIYNYEQLALTWMIYCLFLTWIMTSFVTMQWSTWNLCNDYAN